VTARARKKAAPAKRKATRRPTAGRAGARTRPRVLVLRAPGTNCDRETAHAFERAGAAPFALHLNEVLARPRRIEDARGFVIPGGFSFGDDLGAGTVLGTLLRTRLREAILRLVDKGGIVLGICNGFQVLVRTGLLPGFDGSDDRVVSLALNRQNRYEDRWVRIRAESDRCVFLRRGDVIHCPIAHAEGRFLPRDDAVLERLVRDDQVALRYVAPEGERPAPFPHNPNGAVDDIAGITDPTGRILGLMPHPERNQFPWQDPRFHAGDAPREPEGLRVFLNAVDHLRT